jgi:hypothetical protein
VQYQEDDDFDDLTEDIVDEPTEMIASQPAKPEMHFVTNNPRR